MQKHSKIIYFDKETINNLLQTVNKGSKKTTSSDHSGTKFEAGVSSQADLKLQVPFLKRIAFVLSGKIDASYFKQFDNTTTISTTEISEFEKIKNELSMFEGVQVKDIENSSTFFRVAGGYLNMIKGGIDGVDVKEFNSVLQSFEGYDTYMMEENVYIRFNNSAFISNYRRNDLITSKLVIYCIPVGDFSPSDFDFFHQISKMETMISNDSTNQTLSDVYPRESLLESDKQFTPKKNDNLPNPNMNEKKTIQLYDVLYASVNREGTEIK